MNKDVLRNVLCILYFNYGLLSEINTDGWMDGRNSSVGETTK